MAGQNRARIGAYRVVQTLLFLFLLFMFISDGSLGASREWMQRKSYYYHRMNMAAFLSGKVKVGEETIHYQVSLCGRLQGKFKGT